MKRYLKLYQFFVVTLFVGTIAPVPVIAMDAIPQQQPSKKEQSLLRRWVSNYKRTWQLYKKRRTKHASPEELQELRERMQTIKKQAIGAGLLAAFIAALYGGYSYRQQKIREQAAAQKNVQEGCQLSKKRRKGLQRRQKRVEEQRRKPAEALRQAGQWHVEEQPEDTDQQDAASSRASSASAQAAASSAITPSDRNRQLLKAAESGNAEQVRTLLAQGADPRVYNNEGRNALHVAAAEGRNNVIQALLKNNEDLVNIKTIRPEKPYPGWSTHTWTGWSHLSQYSAGTDWTPTTAFALAAAEGHISTMQLLKARGADIEAGGSATPLVKAFTGYNIPKVKALLEMGANPFAMHDRKTISEILNDRIKRHSHEPFLLEMKRLLDEAIAQRKEALALGIQEQAKRENLDPHLLEEIAQKAFSE